MPTNFVKTTLIDINPNSVKAEAVQSIQMLTANGYSTWRRLQGRTDEGGRLMTKPPLSLFSSWTAIWPQWKIPVHDSKGIVVNIKSRATSSSILTRKRKKSFGVSIRPMPLSWFREPVSKSVRITRLSQKAEAIFGNYHAYPTPGVTWEHREQRSQSKTRFRPRHVAHLAMAVLAIRHVGFTRGSLIQRHLIFFLVCL